MINKWPLARKFGLFTALFSAITLLLGTFTIKPLVFRHQLNALDTELTENAEEIVRDVENFSKPTKAKDDKVAYFRKPFEERFIPPPLRRRYIQIYGPEGQKLWPTTAVKLDLSKLSPGHQTIQISDRNCRFVCHEHGMLKLIIGTRLGTLEAVQEDIQTAIWTATPIVVLLTFFGAWALAKYSLHPVRSLSLAASQIQAAQEASLLPYPKARDEIFRLTEVLNDTFDRLQSAYGAATRFSADASHQLKTPLAVMRTCLDTLSQNDHLTAEDHEEIGILRKQTRRLTALINDLLLLAQMDAGRLMVAPAPSNLTDFLLGMADDTSVLCEEKELEMQVDIPPNLTATTDLKRLQIICQNLLENAVKYTNKPGWIRLAASATETTISIAVENSGTPIPPEHQPHLFERFYRANQGEAIQGHGLGLNISRQLALAMKGELKLVKSDAESTLFTIELTRVHSA